MCLLVRTSQSHISIAQAARTRAFLDGRLLEVRRRVIEEPESGFLQFRWQGYDEALLLCTLALGSPAYAPSEGSYAARSSTYQWQHSYGYDYLYAGSLFAHQLSHMWIDFRGIQGGFMHRTAGDRPLH